jgi:hypothetical protein
VDSGNISDSPAKLDIIMSVMSELKYDAVGLGMTDLTMGPAFYEKAAANKLALLDASPLANKQTVPYVVKDIDGVRVGVISFSALPRDATINEYDLRKARFVTYKEVRSKCDVLVVLDQGGVTTNDWIERNAPRLGAPDIVIPGQWRQVSEEQVVGRTHIMPPHFQAKQLGVIDVEFAPGQPLKVTMTTVPLDEKFAEDQQVAQRVGQGVLATNVQPQPLTYVQSTNRPDVRPYYSPLLCKACHQKQYEDWVQTKHAIALKTLVDNKNATPDCLPCHSELYRTVNRYILTQNQYAGVECATCHANTLPHGLERKDMAVHVKVDPKLCITCHTKDRSPTYDEKTYFPKVVHAIVPPTTTASKPK